MAKIINTFGPIANGKIGDLVFYQLKGKNYVRSAQNRFKDHKTQKQIEHRNKFATLIQLARLFKSVVRFQVKNTNTNFQTFCKHNWKNISIQYGKVVVDYDNLILTDHFPLPLLHLEVKKQSNQIFFQWAKDHLNLDDSFKTICVVFSKEQEKVFFTEVNRNDLSALVTLPYDVYSYHTFTFTYK
ncbi:MAG TPA: DUF6266 family protein [Leptospiraceae bacterium]|nr:DUF6266 family protein [Leptospiraceae bacterium]HMW03850.1 DUF6266 family protein [Leptospiraceae bacterium]HMX32899.1 DUF6266 family protein [Leptospiraceae bacterium]HMY29830.1 DUF6266 family protein [Leptospiraceae bacterium]HMZ65188.1 DUF6266 family protein [Leptospiraceae bacterium]